MKAAFLFLAIFLLIGCTERKNENKNSVKHNIKKFYLGETDDFEEKKPLPKKIIAKKEHKIPMYDSGIYDSLVETKNTSDNSGLSYKQPKVAKKIAIGDEEIKIFDKSSAGFSVEEIEELRRQINSK
jgi:hypothetical protein